MTMQGPVIYHGASNGNGSWPGGGGSVSQLTRTLFFDAGQLVPYQDHIYANPPRLVNSEMWAGYPPPATPGYCWYSRAMAFDEDAEFPNPPGRSFASFVYSLPANYDPAHVPEYRVAFWNAVTGLGFLTVNWELQAAVTRNNTGFSPSGVWVAFHTVLTPVPVPAMQWTALQAVTPDNAAAPAQAGDLVNVFVSRYADGVGAEMYVLGVEVNYRILP